MNRNEYHLFFLDYHASDAEIKRNNFSNGSAFTSVKHSIETLIDYVKPIVTLKDDFLEQGKLRLLALLEI